MNKLQELTVNLAESRYQTHTFNCLPIQGEQSVLRVEVSELDALPLFVTATNTQILCIAYLFHRSEIDPQQEAELHRFMLDLNIPMPLSAFSLVDDYYAIFGALAVNSRVETVQHELVTLANNAIEALEALEPFLK